jgi:hypothetical protein
MWMISNCVSGHLVAFRISVDITRRSWDVVSVMKFVIYYFFRNITTTSCTTRCWIPFIKVFLQTESCIQKGYLCLRGAWMRLCRPERWAYRSKMFSNKMMTTILEPRKKKMKRGWRKLLNKEISTFSCSCNTVTAIEMRGMWEENWKCARIINDRASRERPFMRQRYVFYNKIEMNIIEAVCEVSTKFIWVGKGSSGGF